VRGFSSLFRIEGIDPIAPIFHPMTTPAALEDIFLTALEKANAAQRSAYLDEACRDQPDLRREVERLLSAHREIGGFLESPPTEVADLADTLRDSTVEAPDLGFLSPADRPEALGRLGQYLILEVIGCGGFGIVLKARDERLNRVVAIKTLAQSLAASITARKRFVREAQAAAAVRHENVVHIYAVEEQGPVPYLVMEYVASVSLAEKLHPQGPLPLREILSIGQQVANGLAAAHQQGLVHRDVKPANVLLEYATDRVKLTDFGLARAIDDASLTAEGIIAGTPSYMSPEQARAEPVDHRSDLFSLGSVLYAMCTGQSPFVGSASLGVLKKVIDESPQPIRQLNSDIPEWLTALIDKLMAKQPADRFQSAAEVADLLKAHRAHLEDPHRSPLPVVPAQSTRARPPARSPRRIGQALTAIALLLGFLCLTEVTGITHLMPTIIRIVTGNGVLIVQVDDPGVQVTIEGDGGLVITGAGPQEVRLRPGDYQVRASKDGQPVAVDQPLVTVERGGKQVVKVTREAPKPLSPSEKLEQAKKTWDEANELYNKGVPLRAPDPLEAERLLRRALRLYEALVTDFPGVSKYNDRLKQCRWALGSALNIRAYSISAPSSAAKPEELRQAVALAEEAVGLDPQEKGFWIALGWAYYRAGDAARAQHALEKADKLSIASAPLYHDIKTKLLLAMAYWQTGEKEKASTRFQEAVELIEKHSVTTPDLLMLRDEASKLLAVESQGTDRKSSSQFEKLDVEEIFAEADKEFALGKSLRDTDPRKAEVHLRKALALSEPLVQDLNGEPKWKQKLADYRWWLASSLNLQVVRVVYHNANMSPEEAARAVAASKEAVELVSDSGFYTTLGLAHYRAKNWQEALKALEKAPTEPGYNTCQADFARALVHWQLGNDENARQSYNQAAEWMDQNQPQDPVLQRIRREAESLVKP
jgi:Flp pilus assembly protein TadD/tRNA A-37 threonylcarbamoyl transferase component Bud32